MLRAIFSKPYSELFIVGDGASWAIDEEAKGMKRVAENLNVPAHIIKRAYLNLSQAVHYSSQFALRGDIYKSKHHISLDYFHGKPEQGESYKDCFEALKAKHQKLSRVRVSTKEMEEFVKTSGIDAEKVMRIPIGIDLDIFKQPGPNIKSAARKKLGLPDDAIVIGSFQKDGNGWGEGNEPKWFKGPDIFLKTIEKLHKDIPNLWVLLSGPARGFVKNGLDALGVPYRHHYFKEYSEISKLYDTLDLYLITSREEGGPKAMLEAMAKCVPLVTTAVGQCRDLVKHRENAMMTPIDNVEALYKSASEALTDESLRKNLINRGLFTAAENSLEAQLPLWKEYFKKLID